MKMFSESFDTYVDGLVGIGDDRPYDWGVGDIIRKGLFVLFASIAPLTLSAQTVYESTNEQGVTEFSDQPSSGASEVTVNPNVVNVAPAPEIDTSRQPAKPQAAVKPDPGNVETQSTTVIYNNDKDRLRRKRRAEQNNPDAPGRQPAPQRGNRSPAR